MQSVNMQEFNFYTLLFKGNYKKGVNILKNILDNSILADELISDLIPLKLIFTENVDKNSQSLINAINSHTEYTEKILKTFLNDLSIDTENKSITDIINDKKIMDIAVNSENFCVLLANSTDLMNRVCTSSTALTSVCNSNLALTKIIGNSTAHSKFANTPLAITTVSQSLTGINTVKTSSTIMNKIVANTTAVNNIINNDDILNTVITDSNTYNYFATSSTAMGVIGNSDKALNVLLNNSTALLTTVKTDIAVNKLATTSNGMKFICQNALVLNLITKNSSVTAKGYIENSSHFATYLEDIKASLLDTNYFTVYKDYLTTPFTAVDDTYYVNSTSGPTTSELTATSSIMFIQSIRAEANSSSYPTKVTGLSTSKVWSGYASDYTTVNKILFGGMKMAPYSTSSSYDSYGVYFASYKAV